MFLASCFENDIDYTGNTVLTIQNVVNRMACQISCQYHENCKFWTFGVKEQPQPYAGSCVLKSSDSGRQSIPGLISGPKFCYPTCDMLGKCGVSFDFHLLT